MKYLVAAVFLISTSLAYPVGENEGESIVPLVISDYASVAKSDESGEVHSHEHHVEVHGDVSHERDSPKVERDSSESSEESGSSESGEKHKEQAHPEPEIKESPSSDEKVEHQAQPSQIVNSEVTLPAVHQDPAKVEEHVKVAPESVPHSDLVQVVDPVQHPVQSVSPDVVQPSVESDEAQPHLEEAKRLDEVPKKVPEPEAPALKISEQHDEVAAPDVKQDALVVLSDPVDIVQPKSADEPELKEAPKESKPEDTKAAEEPKPVEEVKPLLKELPAEKLPEEKPKLEIPEEKILPIEKAADPVAPVQEVVKEVVKPVEEIVSDALPLPQSEIGQPKDELKKQPEPEILPEKLPESSSSS